ncbi:MAG: methionyl-tRNA formyltransferase [Betaproteobacteria bacterium]
MRLVFAGTPPFAARALGRLHEAGHEVSLVLSQPDRPAGRGLRTAPSAVKQLALERGLAIAQPATLRSPHAEALVRDAKAEVMVVAAYGMLLPRAILAIPPRGAINIHASLLPRWRGAAPIQRALLAGDRETGITIMHMDEGLDTGPMLSRHVQPIGPHDDAGSLHDKLAALGADAVVAALGELAAGRARATPQPAAGATYARKIAKDEARLDWTRPAVELERAVRAFRPAPGAFAELDGVPLKIWRAELADGRGAPGTVLAASGGDLVVASGDGALRLRELQRAGGRRVSAQEFLRGKALPAGTVLR